MGSVPPAGEYLQGKEVVFPFSGWRWLPPHAKERHGIHPPLHWKAVSISILSERSANLPPRKRVGDFFHGEVVIPFREGGGTTILAMGGCVEGERKPTSPAVEKLPFHTRGYDLPSHWRRAQTSNPNRNRIRIQIPIQRRYSDFQSRSIPRHNSNPKSESNLRLRSRSNPNRSTTPTPNLIPNVESKFRPRIQIQIDSESKYRIEIQLRIQNDSESEFESKSQSQSRGEI